MASMIVARAAARPVQVGSAACKPQKCHCAEMHCTLHQAADAVVRAPLQAARSSKAQPRQLAFRAPARAMYFHSRQSIVAAAAEVRRRRRRRVGGRQSCGTTRFAHCAVIVADSHESSAQTEEAEEVAVEDDFGEDEPATSVSAPPSFSGCARDGCTLCPHACKALRPDLLSAMFAYCGRAA